MAGFSPPPLRPGAPRAAPGVTPASCPSYSTTWIPPGGQRDCKAWLGHCPPCPRHPRGSPPPWAGQGPRWSGCHPPAFTHSPKMLCPISLKSSACQCLISTGPAPGDALLRKFPRDGKFHSFMCGSWRLEAIRVFILREQQTDGSEASAPRASTVRRDV